MSFFKRHPRVWLVFWALLGFGGSVMTFEAVFNRGLDVTSLIRGLIGLGVGGLMISYLLPTVRNTNAPN